uniref:Phage head-tail adaptor n=1 Tax=uncultured bacterium Contig643 TaxID=1393602 RepID=W0FKV1_9BACT|nr:hypothetical protein [uncultured bacterium Contig643]
MKRIKSRFTPYNDGILFVCQPESAQSSFNAVKNTTAKKDIKRIIQLNYVELNRRDRDFEFAESQGRTLSMKVKTRLYSRANSNHMIMIGNRLYSIFDIDKDTRTEEMYLYLEEIRRLT